MAVSSAMLPLGTSAPDFNLIDVVTGQYVTLKKVKSTNATLIMFICNHCPYVKHVQQGILNLAKDYQAKGVGFVAISSNDPISYPDDAPEKMKEIALQFNFPFPYLFDETQDVAKAYQAVCTPDFFLFDKELKCVYRGQMDDSRPSNGKPVTAIDLRNALDNLLSGKAVDPNQVASIGCSIKWK